MRTRNTRSQTKRRVVIARGNDAAARLRKEVRSAGWYSCALCPGEFLPSGIEIDHILPIFKGGEDVESNVQALCVSCHKAKTHTDCGYTTPPF